MSAPKIIGAVLLSIILFIALCVFSVAITVKVTALSSSYVTSLVEDIPVSEILEEAGKQGDNDDSRQLNIIKGIIDNNETAIKERVIMLVNDIYDYLNSKSDDIDIAHMLGDTVLDSDFITSLVEGSDLKPLLEEFIEDLIADKGLPSGSSLDEFIDNIAVAIEPWAKEQAGIVIPPAFDYVFGNSDTFSVSFSLDVLKDALKENLKQSFLSSPPQKYQGLSQTELGQTFDTLFEQYSGEIPASYTFNEEMFTNQDGTSMTIDVTEFEQALRDSRDGIGIFNIAFIALIILILLLIAGIVLIYRDIRWSALNLGVVSFVFGAGLMVFYFTSLWMIRDFLARQEISFNAAIRDWLISMSDAPLLPILIMSICFVAAGITLLVTYFVYQRRQRLDEAPVYCEKIDYSENDRGDTSV
jgi:hypothetical protein